MIVLISPAKTLDLTETKPPIRTTQPRLLDASKQLATQLKKLSEKDLQKLMSISAKLAKQVHEYYSQFKTPFTQKNSKPAILTFKGDVYRPFDFDKYKKAEFERLQKRVRILSGFYGILRPMDLMQPYRLEMGTKLKNRSGKDLYAFWGDQISKKLNADAKSNGSKYIVNLASDEYFNVIDQSCLKYPVIKVDFKEKKNNTYKVIGLFAKQARGVMTDYIVRKNVTTVSGLKKFKESDYKFNAGLSTDDRLVFTRG